MTDLTISVADSPLQQALDAYYSFLFDLLKRPGVEDKLLVNGTINSFDIAQDTPFYNEGLFRNFADRVFMGSPQGLGPANRADRFSTHYEQIVRIAASTIDQKHPDILDRVSVLSRELDTQTGKLGDKIQAIEGKWQEICAHGGPKPTDPDYDLRHIAYLESVRYADQVQVYSDNIDSLISQIDATRRAVYSQSEQTLLDTVNDLTQTKKVARPRRPTLERGRKVDEITFADPTVRIEAICDISPSAFPMGDLVAFLKNTGSRALNISKTTVAQRKHDSQWSVGGSARYSIFGISIGGGGGGSGASGYQQDISKLASLDISFENIDDIGVDRDMWFNPGVFQNADLAKMLGNIGGIDRLQYASESLVLARGLKLTLHFDSQLSDSAWSKETINGSGGVSVFGFSFGGSGSSETHDFSSTISGDKKSVTFADDSQLTRLLGVRLETFWTPKRVLLRNGEIAMAPQVKSAFDAYMEGKIGLLDFQEAKFR
jgi:hypothetical protein